MASRHEASLILDGRPTADLHFGDVILVRRGAHAFRLVSFSTTNFYEAFRSKFNFRIRPDAVPTRTAATNGP
jgi:NAD+ kinase